MERSTLMQIIIYGVFCVSFALGFVVLLHGYHRFQAVPNWYFKRFRGLRPTHSGNWLG